MLTSLLKAVGIHDIAFKAGSTVRRGRGTVEVALVLDNSGSMAGTYIADLRTAAREPRQRRVHRLRGHRQGEGRRRAVRGLGQRRCLQHQRRLDGHRRRSRRSTSENFVEPKTRFELFNAMGVGWGGCVEARPAPHDVTDSLPTTSTPETLFVPMFNPDEPDGANDAGNSYGNNYLPDYGGTCPAPPPTCLQLQQEGQLHVLVGAAGADAAGGAGARVQVSGSHACGGRRRAQLPVRQLRRSCR